MADLQHQRRVMVDNQIRTFDVTDRDLLAAFAQVPREVFLDAGDRETAYTDRTVTVRAGDTERAMLPPLILARLLQALQPEAGERALDVLGGTGYSAAILAAMGLATTAIEADPAMSEAARAACAAAGQPVTIAPTASGLAADHAPVMPTAGFDVILINGASERVPTGFFPLLVEGGRLGLIQVHEGAMRALIYLKSDRQVSPRRAFDASAPVLPGFVAEPGFVF